MRGFEKAILAIVIVLALVPIAQALAITSVTAPESVLEGEVLQVSFAVDEPSNQYVFKNNQLVGSNNYTWQTGLSDSGTYTFKFLANNTNQSVEEERVVEVLDSPSTVSIVTPVNDVLSNGQVRISATTSSTAGSCNYTLEGETSGSLNYDGDEWVKILLLGQDKIYNLTVNCQISGEESSDNVIFILDTTPPAITSKSPEGSYAGTPVTIEIESDENSVCKYSSDDEEFDQMPGTFSQTGGTEHKQILGLEDQADTTFYVACEDRHGNKMQGNEEITFFANLKPKAEIHISGGNSRRDILKPGTYDIELDTSESVINPTLEYEYSNEGDRTTISLEGQGTHWEGFLAIPETSKSDIGTFYYSAEDLTGLSGSEIAEGKIFIVDTIKPEGVEDVELSTEGIDVKVEWFYEGETVENFIIYRDVDSDVDYLDKWAETPNEVFVDNTVFLGQRYYYRIAAEDKAGNIGPLTDVKSITVDYIEEKDINPGVVIKLNKTQEMLRERLFEIDSAIVKLESESDPAKNELIRHLALLDKARLSKNNVEILMKEIDKLKLVELSEDKAERRIEVFLQNADNQMREVVKSISIIDSLSQDQTVNEEDLDEVINEVLIGVKLSDSQKQKYKEEIREIQDRTSVTLEATTAKIYYDSRTEPEEITLVHKKIVTEEAIGETILVENIPRRLARSERDVVFKEKPKVLRPDLMVKWERGSLTSTDIYYHLKKIAELGDVREVKTFLLEKPREDQLVEITGSVVSEPEPVDGQDLTGQLFVMLGFIVMISLFVYYVAYVKEGETRHKHTIVTQSPAKQKLKDKSRALYSHVKEANDRADNLEYEEALELYKRILVTIEKEEMHPGAKKKLDEEIKHLYAKLNMMSHIQKAHSHVDGQNHEKLKNALSNIKEHYTKLKEETGLASHARENYSYFLMHLKNKDQEEFFDKIASDLNTTEEM